MALLLSVIPWTAQAGFFDFVTSFINGTSASAESLTSGNLQHIALLQAATNPDPNPAKGGGDITIVGGSALLPEAGPGGTLADTSVATGSDTISIYVVHKGDTLSQIAKMFGVSVNTIIWSNDIVKGVIHEGDKLIILPISGVRHIVVKGDTIQIIAKKYKADAGEIAQFNSLTSATPLKIGEEIIVPDGEATVIVQNSSSSVNPLRGAGGPDLVGYYMRPILGGRKTQSLHGYNAVDLSDGHEGTPVFAAAPGSVIISKSGGWNGGYGNYVVIQHPNNTQTLYSHFSQNLVTEGQVVARGQLIGLMGATGKATGPHVHFEIRGAKNPF